ncbi:MAG: glycosyltransferase, partial [Muribaculaceae bacterium]|nr:glycosyltransferase [Muribaculaceae bacterium]
MTATPEISIIVPVYKVEKYLREALDSILAQTFTDWECILVDDGSPDACGAICDEYAAADPRFRVIHQTNGGQGAARNAGINECRAPYVTFVDSDDTVRPKYLARLHELITGYGTDMAEVGFTKLFRHRGWDIRPVEHITQLNQKEIINELLLSKMLPSYVWAKIFRRECIGPDFAEGMKFEDITALASWAEKIPNAVMSPAPRYCYR